MKPSSNQPVPCTCPYCHQSIVTRVEKSNGLVVWLAATGICLLGCALGCCLIPFFIDGIKV
jgi:lipopolysaccharide-induced tumor necrosis factor-alpha factor